jgi:hypothetical protein
MNTNRSHLRSRVTKLEQMHKPKSKHHQLSLDDLDRLNAGDPGVDDPWLAELASHRIMMFDELAAWKRERFGEGI